MTGNSTGVAEPLVNPMMHVWARRGGEGTVTHLIAHVWEWDWERAEVARRELDCVAMPTSGCGELNRVALVHRMLTKSSVSGVKNTPVGYVRVVYPRLLGVMVDEARRWVTAQRDLVGAWWELVQERRVARAGRRPRRRVGRSCL